MNFESFSALLSMGGHGLYVWLSYAIALIVVMANVIAPVVTKKQLFTEQKRRLRREEGNQ